MASIRTITLSQMRCLAGSLFALICADGLLTSFLLQHGLARETNPLIQGIAGEDAFPFVKLGFGLIAAALLLHVHRKRPKLAAGAAAAGVLVYAGIVYWNILAFAIASL